MIFLLCAFLFLLDAFTAFDIKSQAIKFFCYIGTLFGTPFTLIWNFFVIKPGAQRMIRVAIPVSFLFLIVWVGPLKMVFSTASWRTQTILYQHRHSNFRTIEFQLQDLGALGYNRRTVEVFYLTPLFMWTSDVPDRIQQREVWIRVDREVNDYQLPEIKNRIQQRNRFHIGDLSF